ncbi:HSP20-like chaperones domain-containing protein [Dioscorea alata]|uniref:HSP20-like chaperones domain-containing protein n=1 Tax=Dioscorea alata TaxID=55571 RepID=A0ACB7VU30_DIOAL|nr:HSP20-like chaperones domain-containing protein [Dioscorea alata]
MLALDVVEIQTHPIDRVAGGAGGSSERKRRERECRREMGESLLTTLSMENNHHPSTLLSMDSCAASAVAEDDCDRELMIQPPRPHAHQLQLSRPPPDINLPLSADPSPPPPPPPHLWSSSAQDVCDMLDVGLGPHQLYDPDSTPVVARPSPASIPRKCARRGDSIWGAWFFFNFYFKPVLSDKAKSKIVRDTSGAVSGFDKSDLRLDVFLVQHDMENMYMWVFKERAENALGKMQLRSFMNGHSRLGEPQFPFSVDKGFVRSHRMQRKHYRGLSNPQCVHGIEVVRSPNLSLVSDLDRKKWMELTGRELNFSIPLEASDFGSWRNLPSTEFELERAAPQLKGAVAQHPHSRKLLNGSGLNLSTQPSNHSIGDGAELLQMCSKRRKDFLPHPMDEDCCLPANSYSDRSQDMDIHPIEPSWLNEFSGVMRHAYGPVTAAKTIYEDDEGYLIVVSLPFSDQQKVKVSWKNNLTHGIVKISCFSTGRMPSIKRHDRTFRLTDPSPEHCPPGEFIREIPLATRIPEDAKLEAYYDETGTVLEIMVPKHRVGPEEHEVHVCMRPPHLGANELLLT